MWFLKYCWESMRLVIQVYFGVVLWIVALSIPLGLIGLMFK